ncbi:MAG: hypothetical protein IPL21_15515 [Saprospirales bacterium]|nr:hypothetical protein [Saprospirales bacterium]
MKTKSLFILLIAFIAFISCKKENAKTPDVYIAGYQYNDNGHAVAKYWKNGIAVTLSDGTHDELAISIFVVGNDVYVLGVSYESTKLIVKYWKNGVATYLTDGTFRAYADKITVVNNNVYISGSTSEGVNSKAVYWKMV